MKFKALYSFLEQDLDIVERELEKSVQSNDPLLRDAGLHLLQAGGKRIRPVFVLLSAMFGQYDIQKIKHIAVALELIHMASLVHDDVIDDAELRRGKATIKSKWDNQVAMYTGDYLFARSLQVITEIDKPLAHQLLAKTIVEVALGEIEQIKDKYNFDQTYRTYLRRIKRKTALLIATSCQVGAVSADVKEDWHTRLFWFGYYVGLSYQIIDDVLDFTSTKEQLGKPVGSDLLQGNVTLPVLIAMEDESLKQKIIQVNEHTTEEEMKPIIEEIIKSGAVEKSISISNRYLEKSLNMLSPLPRSRMKSALVNIAKYIGKRKF
ncbi:heptaprenyl diphosphate synthase component II [Bacillus sp. FJAT-47783]|uniref:heptaprenyl diphosphate synthase component II n=1 Tax=Bacillus sp. FJAT-47783 TaxID=2922712 RepID=UPI001FAB6FD0|nr:heptaprenyl diphosphate synthase component II [Bacillus sp. FJAT-47783]